MAAALLCGAAPEVAGFAGCSTRSVAPVAAPSSPPEGHACGAAPPRARVQAALALRCGVSSNAATEPTEVCSPTRRMLLRSTAGGLGLWELWRAPAATAAAAVEEEEEEEEEEGAGPAAAQPATDGRKVALPKLASRFAKGQIKTLGPAGPLGPPDAAAPAWLEGTWRVTYTFERASFPLTKDFAQFKQLLAGSVRSPADSPGVVTETTQVRHHCERE